MKELIKKYNNLRGRITTKAQLQQLIAEAENCALRSPSEGGAAAKTIISKLSKALDKMTGSKARLNFKPLPLRSLSEGGKKPAAASERAPITRRSKSEGGKKKTGSGNRKGRTKGVAAAPSGAISKSDLLSGIPVITDFSDIDEVQGLSGGNKVYDYITERIAAKIKKGGLFWRERWKKSKLLNIPGVNFASKKAYNGINFLLTHGQMRLHDSPYFLTMKQANRLGGKVKEGSDGYPVVFYKKIIRDKETGEIVEKKERGKKYNEYFALRYYLVFNSADIEGIDFNLPKEQELKQIDFQDISIAEKIVEGMPKRPPIKHEGSRAFYMPVKDSVTMPPKERFKSEANYYSTLFHELVHSTMHKSRLHRKAPKKILATDHYAFEELVAELGASFLNSEANILYHNIGSSAAYLEGYQKSILGAMENDNKFIFKASAYAQKAGDYILNGKSYREESLKPAKKKVTDRKPIARKPEKEEAKQMELALSGAVRLDQQPEKKDVETFTLPTDVGRWLGEQQRYRLVISLDGETHAGKSELAKQIVNAFAAKGMTIAWRDLEQGGLESKDTSASFERNIDKENYHRIFVFGEAPEGIETIRKDAQNPDVDVIAIDSGTKLMHNDNSWIDRLRVEFPHKIFIVILQQNQKGGTRGGSSVTFDAPVHIKVYRPDHTDYTKNYAELLKNRGNPESMKYYYLVADKKTVEIESLKSEKEEENV
jgi:antirestriction protein ArdC